MSRQKRILRSRRYHEKKRKRHDKTVKNLERRLLEDGALFTEKFVEISPRCEIDLIAVYESHVELYEVKGRHTKKGFEKAVENQLPRQAEVFLNYFGNMPIHTYYYAPKETIRIYGFDILVK